MLFTVNICFGKKGLKCYGSKMDIEIQLFSMLWSKGEIILVGFIIYGLIMRLLRILNSLRILFLDFYKNLYTESIFNVPDTSTMEDFIGSYILELVSSEENMLLIKCPDFLEIKTAIFNLNGNSAFGPDGFDAFFCTGRYRTSQPQ